MWSDGGGFDTSVSGGGFSSPASTEKKERKYKDTYITPCSINQILSSKEEDDAIMISGRRMGYVCLIAQVQSVNQTSTAIDYELTDDSSMEKPLKVKHWLAENAGQMHTFQPGEHCRVFGHVRIFQGQLTMLAFKVQQVTSDDEIRTHALEVELSKVWTESATARDATNPGGSGVAQGGGTMDYSNVGGGVTAGFTPQQKQVYDVIYSVQDPAGAAVSFITDRLPSLNQIQIRNAIEFLSSEGHVYSTIDEEHYKATDS